MDTKKFLDKNSWTPVAAGQAAAGILLFLLAIWFGYSYVQQALFLVGSPFTTGDGYAEAFLAYQSQARPSNLQKIKNIRGKAKTNPEGAYLKAILFLSKQEYKKAEEKINSLSKHAEETYQKAASYARGLLYLARYDRRREKELLQKAESSFGELSESELAHAASVQLARVYIREYLRGGNPTILDRIENNIKEMKATNFSSPSLGKTLQFTHYLATARQQYFEEELKTAVEALERAQMMFPDHNLSKLDRAFIAGIYYGNPEVDQAWLEYQEQHTQVRKLLKLASDLEKRAKKRGERSSLHRRLAEHLQFSIVHALLREFSGEEDGKVLNWLKDRFEQDLQKMGPFYLIWFQIQLKRARQQMERGNTFSFSQKRLKKVRTHTTQQIKSPDDDSLLKKVFLKNTRGTVQQLLAPQSSGQKQKRLLEQSVSDFQDARRHLDRYEEEEPNWKAVVHRNLVLSMLRLPEYRKHRKDRIKKYARVYLKRVKDSSFRKQVEQYTGTIQ